MTTLGNKQSKEREQRQERSKKLPATMATNAEAVTVNVNGSVAIMTLVAMPDLDARSRAAPSLVRLSWCLSVCHSKSNTPTTR
jgi:hypothetical protein